ncbi:glycoside hydrolase family 16 protein [Sphingobacterium sp. SGG-5]|uniref:glycoside hydrolase family 16 protein n=1 Tax=Sphingobacterium sp. SGG-5 TaxID=2710881 RepID=UPI0013EB84CA|nr:glycoside hydrolase family 16 protein [Sphingobacterium sp. SGG-5]NGM62488.1 glycoside hydrolase family 16 protein [Sphingobacterium sp. SGG-5]
MIQYLINRFKIFFSVAILFSSCSSSGETDIPPPISTDRIIEFSGYEWIVRTSNDNKVGPGPNYFSDSEDNVWVDDDGRLHLKIVRIGGTWYCSGVILKKPLGYGKYVFYVGNDVSKLDQNIVAGLFTYFNDEEEIDIEFSRWSDPDNEDSQFAVQPSHLVGNKVRYNLDLLTEYSTHAFNWQSDRIEFVSLQGHGLAVNGDNLIHEWTYRGDNIPPNRTAERLRMNLWLFRGQVPSDSKTYEMIIDKFEFIKEN